VTSGRTHLVTGVAGQDGVLLARRLADRGERVVGTILPGSTPATVVYLDGVELVEHDVRDEDGFARLVASYRPDAVHNLAAVSSVRLSWEQPELTGAINHEAVSGMLDVLRRSAPETVFVQASTSDIFGPVGGSTTVDESTPLAPVSPYGEAKAAAHRAVAEARGHGLAATNLVLFGHTSPLHAAQFVIPRIVRSAAEVAAGTRTSVSLQNPYIRRDWGAAVDVVAAFDAASTGPAGDYVIGTGVLHELTELVTWAVTAAGCPETPLEVDDDEVRPNDFGDLCADPARAGAALGWRSRTPLRQVIERMVAVERLRLATGTDDDPAYLEASA